MKTTQRRYWLFAGSKAGAERAATIYTVIKTTKLNRVEPRTDTSLRSPQRMAYPRWDEFMRRNWTPRLLSLAQAI